MDSQPNEVSEEGEDGEEEELDGPVREASQPADPVVEPQQMVPSPHHPEEGVNAMPSVAAGEPPAGPPTVVAAAAPTPLPTGPRVTVPVGWKRIVLLDSVIYYR